MDSAPHSPRDLANGWQRGRPRGTHARRRWEQQIHVAQELGLRSQPAQPSEGRRACLPLSPISHLKSGQEASFSAES